MNLVRIGDKIQQPQPAASWSSLYAHASVSATAVHSSSGTSSTEAPGTQGLGQRRSERAGTPAYARQR